MPARPGTTGSRRIDKANSSSGKPTLQAESLTEPELSERSQLAVRRANRFLSEQPESNFRVGHDSGVGHFGQHSAVFGDVSLR